MIDGWWRPPLAALAVLFGLVADRGDRGLAEGLDGASETRLEALKARYRRPEAVPFPAENPYSRAKAELGRRLFFDPALSGDGTIACATCHNAEMGWEDGLPTATGVGGATGPRHTPTLWNLAWGELFFWDGRAESLEAQVAEPIESPIEMNLPLDVLVERLRADPGYRRAFSAAFPETPEVSRETLVQAVTTYERTLVSPLTRFDRWVEGDESALGEDEKRGFLLFNGKAGCANCHEGWNFTDNAFHDIGLDDSDPGRGAVIELPAAEHAFKTPGLRDIGRRAPYMHDGSLKTLEAVIEHYEEGFLERPTLSADMNPFALTPGERNDLLAFLATLSAPGKTDTQPAITPRIARAAPVGAAAATTMISQRDKAFRPGHIRIAAGDVVRILNDDTRTHNVRIHDPALEYNSGAQEPGETIEVRFEEPGTYYAFCAIHPKMKLVVEVGADR